jgi:hypothetical protein
MAFGRNCGIQTLGRQGLLRININEAAPVPRHDAHPIGIRLQQPSRAAVSVESLGVRHSGATEQNWMAPPTIVLGDNSIIRQDVGVDQGIYRASGGQATTTKARETEWW